MFELGKAHNLIDGTVTLIQRYWRGGLARKDLRERRLCARRCVVPDCSLGHQPVHAGWSWCP